MSAPTPKRFLVKAEKFSQGTIAPQQIQQGWLTFNDYTVVNQYNRFELLLYNHNMPYFLELPRPVGLIYQKLHARQVELTIRVSSSGKATLRLKSADPNYKAPKFTTDIPLAVARKIIQKLPQKYQWDRYEIPYGQGLWKIDRFNTHKDTFLIATAPDNYNGAKPKWLDRDISTDQRFLKKALYSASKHKQKLRPYTP